MRELSIHKGKVTVQIRGNNEIPSYGLRGYKIRWAVESSDGKELRSGEVELPDLKPGDTVWTAILPSDASAHVDEQSVVSLITPLGYRVDDNRQSH